MLMEHVVRHLTSLGSPFTSPKQRALLKRGMLVLAVTSCLVLGLVASVYASEVRDYLRVKEDWGRGGVNIINLAPLFPFNQRHMVGPRIEGKELLMI